MALLLGILIFVHELGHFLVGRFFGIGVEIFSLGFGPSLFSFRYKNTEYRLSALPLGGFVKFAGSLPSEPVDPIYTGQEFHLAPWYAKIATIAAGPLANFLLTISIYACLGMQGIEHPAPIIGEIRSHSPAERAGLEPGDRVLSIDQHVVKNWTDLQKFIQEATSPRIHLVVSRSAGIPIPQESSREKSADEKIIEIDLNLDLVDLEDFAGRSVKRGRAGVAFGFLPPVLTVLAGSNPASLAGLRTGEEIVSIRVLDPDQRQEAVSPKTFDIKTFDIKTWADALRAFDFAFHNNADQVELRVSEAAVPADKVALSEKNLSPKETQVRVLKQLRAVWSPLRQDFDVHKKPAPHSLRRQLAASLGLTSSELTVAETPKGKLDTSTSNQSSPDKPGVQKRDQLLQMDGKDLVDVYDLMERLSTNQKPVLAFTVQREGLTQNLDLALVPVDLQKPSGKQTVYTLDAKLWGPAIFPSPILEIYESPVAALSFATRTTGEQTFALLDVLRGLFTGQVPLQSLGGPMLIAKVAGDSAKLGGKAFLMAMALISLNLGVMNLFPIPALDGGQLLIQLFQAVRRRALSEAALENFQRLGFALLLALVVLATYNDLSRFWSSMLGELKGVFG